MIFDQYNDNLITTIPHEESLELIQMCLTEKEIQTIENEINSKLDKVNIVNSGFIPGSNWWLQPSFQVLIDKIANKNFEFAGLLFDLIMWITIQKREDMWSFKNYPPYGLSKTYFRINNIII